VADRWATFDCYGTLIDWNGGIGDELARVFGAERRERLLHRYHEIEPQIQEKEPALPYRHVMARALARLADEEGVELPEHERDALALSLPGWTPFAEVRTALRELRERGWRLVILSNTDRDLIDASMAQIGVPFELAIVASEIGSYKPAHGHWKAFYEQTGADPERHVHVAASLFHDVAPCAQLGIPCVWINRLQEARTAEPTVELPELSALPDTLDALRK
jgi:2-haloacid dehalogenase